MNWFKRLFCAHRWKEDLLLFTIPKYKWPISLEPFYEHWICIKCDKRIASSINEIPFSYYGD